MIAQEVTCHPVQSMTAPWHQEQVRLGGKPIGYLIYRVIHNLPGCGYGPGWTQYVISNPTHRRITDPWCSFLDRQVAIEALVAHTVTGARAA